MLVSRRLLLSMALSAAVSASPVGATTIAVAKPAHRLSLADVISRHTVARGGAKALDRVHAVLVMPTIVEKGSTLQARYLCNDAAS